MKGVGGGQWEDSLVLPVERMPLPDPLPTTHFPRISNEMTHQEFIAAYTRGEVKV
jgi:hypothetical protein